VRHNLRGVWLFVLFGANASFSQSLTPATPAKKYIRLNGSVVAIENAPLGAPTISLVSPSAGTAVAGNSQECSEYRLYSVYDLHLVRRKKFLRTCIR
jgi:hypothetical protein